MIFKMESMLHPPISNTALIVCQCRCLGVGQALLGAHPTHIRGHSLGTMLLGGRTENIWEASHRGPMLAQCGGGIRPHVECSSCYEWLTLVVFGAPKTNFGCQEHILRLILLQNWKNYHFFQIIIGNYHVLAGQETRQF